MPVRNAESWPREHSYTVTSLVFAFLQPIKHILYHLTFLFFYFILQSPAMVHYLISGKKKKLLF